MRAIVRIEPMREADIGAVASIEGATRMDPAQLRDELARSWSRSWVAREPDGAVVGFVLAWHVTDELHLLNVATRPDRRRRGVARALLVELLCYARAARVAHVLLEVRRSNAIAMTLYRSLGFFAMGLRARYYPDDEDAVEMVLMLDPATGDVLPHADEVRLES
jgi:ribosomal-protein-alanine N-acetyltransferase